LVRVVVSRVHRGSVSTFTPDRCRSARRLSTSKDADEVVALAEAG
jgi:hypothetical protein